MITEIIRPNAVGDYSECFQYPSSGAHWDKVDDVSPDDDATYVQAPAIAYQPARKEAYHLPSLSGLPSLISSVVVYARVRRVAQNPAGGYHAYACVGIRIGGSNYYTGHNIYGNSYTTISKTFSTNPNTGQPWTKDDIDNLQSYIALDWYNRALYQGGYIAARCTQVYVEITYLAPPSVTTMPATNIGATSATLNGMLDSDGGLPSDCGFDWGPDTNYGNITPTQQKSTGETFSQVIGGLQPNTTYHFRAFASNPYGTSYGSDQSFTTAAVLPAVATAPATDIQVSKATLHGVLTDDGGESCDSGFEWGLTAGYGNETPRQSDKHTGDAFVQPIAGLQVDTVYHFRARARNSAGLASGADMTFRTLKEAIEVPGSLVDPSLKLLLEEET